MIWPGKGVGHAGPAAIIAALPISLAFSAATACSWPEQAFAAGGDNGNESFESRFLCTGTRLCYTTDLWRTDIHVLVYIIENRVRHVARDIQTAGFSQWLASLEEEKGCDKVTMYFPAILWYERVCVL